MHMRVCVAVTTAGHQNYLGSFSELQICTSDNDESRGLRCSLPSATLFLNFGESDKQVEMRTAALLCRES